MQQFRIQRTFATLALVAGQAIAQDLPRGYDYEALYLRLTGGVQVTTLYTAVRAEAPAQAIARVEVVADGRNTLYSAPFWYSVLGSAYARRQTENGARYLTPPSGAGVATYQVEALGVVDFQTPDSIRGKDSNFRTSALSLFQLRLTCGNPGDMFTGAGVSVFSSLNVELSTSEMIELPDAAGKMTTPLMLKKTSFQEIAVPTTNANQEIRLPAGNLIKSAVLRTEGSVTAGEPSTAMLTNLQAFAGTDVRLNMTAGSLRGKNNMDFGYITAGYYIADFTRSGDWLGQLTELWDVTKQAEPKLSMNIVGGANNKAQVVVTEYLAVG